MGRNLRHICLLLEQLAQSPEHLRHCQAQTQPHLHVGIFRPTLIPVSLIKPLKAKAFAQYAPLPSLWRVIICNLSTCVRKRRSLWVAVSLSLFSTLAGLVGTPGVPVSPAYLSVYPTGQAAMFYCCKLRETLTIHCSGTIRQQRQHIITFEGGICAWCVNTLEFSN